MTNPEARFARDLDKVLRQLQPAMTPRDFAILFSPSARTKPKPPRRDRKPRSPRK